MISVDCVVALDGIELPPLAVVDDDSVDVFLPALVDCFVAAGGHLNEHASAVCWQLDGEESADFSF